jgi:hypothetical protein
LKKQLVFRQNGTSLYGVNAFAVRDASQGDEEFTNHAIDEDFPGLIPPDEVWVSARLVDREALFFFANALARRQALSKGRSSDAAYEAGLEVERSLRESIEGIAFHGGKPDTHRPKGIYQEQYITLEDDRGPVTVWLIDGCLARDRYKTDYAEGGHGYVYPWVPRDEIWVEQGIDRGELPFVVVHEYLERRLMRDAKLEYDKAHPICSQVEYRLRERSEPISLLCSRPRKLEKRDLPRLADPAFYDYAVEHYVKK